MNDANSNEWCNPSLLTCIWLKTICRPDLSKVLDETIFGIAVMRVAGEDVASEDVLSLSFTGQVEHVKGYLSQSSPRPKKVFYGVKQPAAPDPKQKPLNRETWHDSSHCVTDQVKVVMTALHKKFKVRDVPPPPSDHTQVVQLRWMPSKKPSLQKEPKMAFGTVCLQSILAPRRPRQRCSNAV